jgi:hypothetical protein
MPIASQAQKPKTPADLSAETLAFIKSACEQVFGSEIGVRHYGTDFRWQIHVEVRSCKGLERETLIGLLATRADHMPHVEITERSTKPKGDAKIAYRQGVFL